MRETTRDPAGAPRRRAVRLRLVWPQTIGRTVYYGLESLGPHGRRELRLIDYAHYNNLAARVARHVLAGRMMLLPTVTGWIGHWCPEKGALT